MHLHADSDITIAEVSAALRAAGLDLRAAVGGLRIVRRAPAASGACAEPGCTAAATITVPAAEGAQVLCARHGLTLLHRQQEVR